MRTKNLQKAKAHAVGLFVALAIILLQAMPAAARGAPDSFADLAEKLSPAVVNITTSKVVAGREVLPMPRAPRGSPLQELFPDLFGPEGQGNKNRRRASALGSGFIIEKSGNFYQRR